MVRDDVEQHPEAGLARRGAERAELGLAAQVLRDTRRVDDVVAVRRAAAGLQRRREIEVRSAELGDVGNGDLPRGAEVEVLGQLEAVGAPEIGHGRRRSASERPTSVTFARARKRPSTDGSGRELHLPARAEPARRERERDLPAVRIEEEQERVVDDVAALAACCSGISCPFRKTPSVCASWRCQSFCVIRRPSGRNHHTSGRPEPRTSPPVRNFCRRNTGWL